MNGIKSFKTRLELLLPLDGSLGAEEEVPDGALDRGPILAARTIVSHLYLLLKIDLVF